MDIILYMVAGILSMIGLCEIFRWITFYCTRPKGNSLHMLLVLKDAGSCELSVRSAAERIRWLGYGELCRLICIIDSDDEELRKICEMLSRQYKFIDIFKPEDIQYDSLVTGFSE